jgi:serine/threonine protein phosphatase PrpC
MASAGQLHLVPNRFTANAFAPIGADTLALRVGHASAAGRRESNEDFFGLVTPKGTELAAKGVLAAVADGVSGGHGGRDAAEYTVRSLLADYYATPDTWSVPLALDRVLSAANRWLLAQGAAQKELSGMACTLSALVLRGARYHLAHVGDTRVYRLRSKALTQLTQDHVWDRPDMQHVLKRAVGLDRHLAVDYAEGEVLGNDVFLICSDGVWEPLGQARIHELVQLYADPQFAAQELVAAALRAGGQDNASAIVLRVDAVSPHGWKDLLDEGRRLPVPPRLKPGSRIDEFEVLDLVHESRATLLYRVCSRRSGQVFALKTLQPLLAHDAQSCEGLLAEEWLAKRLVSPLFAQVVPLAASARSFLYYVMSFHKGRSLQQMLDDGAHFDMSDITRIGTQVAKGLGALHRLSILHRDIKPSNLLQETHGGLRVLDLGVALAGGVPYPELSGNPGTPSFMAPELFEGSPASVQTDLYAAGVTLYHLLTRRYPYGEIEPFQTPRFGDPVRPTRYRPDIPQWLENVLLRAVARDPAQRFETAEEFLVALERGDRYPPSAPLSTPLMQRDRATRWQAFGIAMLLVNLLLLYLLLLR